MSKQRKRRTKSKTAFYRLFVAVENLDDKEEVYAKETTYADAIKVANEYKSLDISLVLLTGRTPNKVVYKYDGNKKILPRK